MMSGMLRGSIRLLSVVASLALTAGCTQPVGGEDVDADGAEMGTQDTTVILNPLPSLPGGMTESALPDGVRLTTQQCVDNGLVVRDGGVYQVTPGPDHTITQVYLGPDLTGLTARPSGSVHHAEVVWAYGSIYVCNANVGYGGLRAADVAPWTEYVNQAPVTHPGCDYASGQCGGEGMFHGVTQLFGPVDTPSGRDYDLVLIECCKWP